MDTTTKRLFDAARHVSVDNHDTWEIVAKRGMQNVLVTRHDGQAAVVGLSGHRIALATTKHPSLGKPPHLLNAITGELVPGNEGNPAKFPPWVEAMNKVREPPSQTIQLDRVRALGDLLAWAVQLEQASSTEFAKLEDTEPDCPCDNPGRNLLRDIEIRIIALLLNDGVIRFDPLLEDPGQDAYGVNWWYLVQALTFALDNQPTVVLRRGDGAIEVHSEADGVTLQSIMMPVLLTPKLSLVE